RARLTARHPIGGRAIDRRDSPTMSGGGDETFSWASSRRPSASSAGLGVGAKDDDAAHDRRDDLHVPDLVGGRAPDVTGQDRDVAKRAWRKVPAPGLVTEGVGGIDGHGA